MDALRFDLFNDISTTSDCTSKPLAFPANWDTGFGERMRLVIGKHLKPLPAFDDKGGVDVLFVPSRSESTVRAASILGRAFNSDVFSIAEADSGNVYVFLGPLDGIFCIPICSGDVYFMGTFSEGIRKMLAGHTGVPVLPKREYNQTHGYEVYAPNDEGVMWVDAPNWTTPTKE